MDADKRGLPRVVDSVEISCRTGYNIRHLANLIYDTAVELRCPGNAFIRRLSDYLLLTVYVIKRLHIAFFALFRQQRKAVRTENSIHIHCARRSCLCYG